MDLMISTFLLIIGLSMSSCLHPNIVFILTDDQDVFLLGPDPMPIAQKLIGNAGMSFTNMFVTSPLCCPSRSSILTGKYLHNHHTMNNSLTGNCSSPAWQKKEETSAFPVYLKSQGYSTFFAGKYLNQYGKKGAGGVEHVPPGWDDWHGLVGNSKYYNYSLSVNGKEEKHGDDYKQDYLTDVISRKALDFMDKQKAGSPLFLMLSTPACHQPFQAAPQYLNNFSDKKAPRTKAFNIHGKDKHWLIEKALTPMPNDTIALVDDYFRKRWRTLLSVDDMIEAVINKLDEQKKLDNTYIFFTSDNGYHLGQFSLPYDKRQAYDFDVRVPLMVRGPGIKANSTSKENIMNIDLAPTFLDIANASDPGSYDGASFLPILKGGTHPFQATVLLEYHGEHQQNILGCPKYTNQGLANCDAHCVCEDSWNNTYGCVRHKSTDGTYKYCAFQDKSNFVELYNMDKDPDEINNIVGSASSDLLTMLSENLADMSLCVGKSCRKPEPIV